MHCIERVYKEFSETEKKIRVDFSVGFGKTSKQKHLCSKVEQIFARGQVKSASLFIPRNIIPFVL